MNILFGYYSCDEGEIFIKGDKVDLTCPKDAIRRGVGMIHQHFALVHSQSVLENVIVGADTSKGIFLDLKSARESCTNRFRRGSGFSWTRMQRSGPCPWESSKRSKS